MTTSILVRKAKITIKFSIELDVCRYLLLPSKSLISMSHLAALSLNKRLSYIFPDNKCSVNEMGHF